MHNSSYLNFLLDFDFHSLNMIFLFWSNCFGFTMELAKSRWFYVILQKLYSVAPTKSQWFFVILSVPSWNQTWTKSLIAWCDELRIWAYVYFFFVTVIDMSIIKKAIICVVAWLAACSYIHALVNIWLRNVMNWAYFNYSMCDIKKTILIILISGSVIVWGSLITHLKLSFTVRKLWNNAYILLLMH